MRIKLILLGLLILFVMTPFSQGDIVQDSETTVVTTTVVATLDVIIATDYTIPHPTSVEGGYTALDDPTASIIHGYLSLDVYSNIIPFTLIAYDNRTLSGRPTNLTDNTQLENDLFVGSSVPGGSAIVDPVALPDQDAATNLLSGVTTHTPTRGENNLQLDMSLQTLWADPPGTYTVDIATYGSATY